MAVVTAVLAVGLVLAVIWLAASLVSQRAAVTRVAAAARALDADPGPLTEREPASLDEALDRLERAVRDATAARAAITKAEARLSWALGAIGHGVVIVDDRGTVVYRNDPAASFLAGRHSDALVEETISSLAEDALRGRAATRELELVGPPRRMLNVRAVPLEDPARPSGALVVVEDMSERRRLENVRRDFVANISHELKTPVGALALLAETLLDEDDVTVTRRLAARLASEAFRVGRTIDDLLELSRLEGASGLPNDPVPVPAVLAEAVDRVRPAAEQRRITIAVDEPTEPLEVTGERRQLVSAVTNLVDNAVKYSEEGSRVEVRARTDGTWVDVDVRDYGIGIPRRDLERIFERFYRVDRARSRETGGTGLGLAIVRHVASNHRGEVRVASREGAGSTFTLRLPVRSGPAALAHAAATTDPPRRPDDQP
ncbi:MAG TPA: ATP-binding protein [Acidimicrobiales bacterium]